MKRYRDIDGAVHCEPAEGGDYTLCGAAMDGETGGEEMLEVPDAISCERCIAIIRFCKGIQLSRALADQLLKEK